MKKNDIIPVIILVVLVLLGLYLALRLIKWIIGLLVAGTSTVMVLLYAAVPLLIIAVVVMIIIRQFKK